MSEKMDQRIRLAVKEELTPPKGLEERTMREIKERAGEKKKTKFQMVFRPAAAVLLLAAVCLAANPAIAKYKPIAKYLFNEPYKNNKKTEGKLQEFRMEIDRVEEEQDLGQLSPFSKIKITPQTAVSDGFKTYVIFKVEGINGFVIKDDIVLDDEMCGIDSLYSEGIEQFGTMEDCYLSDRKENALYYTSILWGTQVSLKEELVIDFAATSLVHAKVDESGHGIDMPEYYLTDSTVIEPGAYRAKIYCKVSGTPKIREIARSKEMPYAMWISPMGIEFKGMTEKNVEALVSAKDASALSVLLKDGSKVPIRLHGGSGPLEGEPGDWSYTSTFKDIISDTDDIRYLVVGEEKYDLKKIEKHQK